MSRRAKMGRPRKRRKRRLNTRSGEREKVAAKVATAPGERGALCVLCARPQAGDPYLRRWLASPGKLHVAAARLPNLSGRAIASIRAPEPKAQGPETAPATAGPAGTAAAAPVATALPAIGAESLVSHAAAARLDLRASSAIQDISRKCSECIAHLAGAMCCCRPALCQSGTDLSVRGFRSRRLRVESVCCYPRILTQR